MIQIVYDKIISYCGTNDIPCVIVGSKIDLQTRYVIHFPSALAHATYSGFQRCPVLTVLLAGR
jgi:hypothetical protein